MNKTSPCEPVRRRLIAAPLVLVAAITGCAASVAAQDFVVLARAEGELQAYRSDGTLRWAADVLDDPHEMVLSPDGARAYVAGYGSGVVSEVDLHTGAVLRRFDLARWGALHGIAIAERGDRIWVSAEEQESVLEIILETGELGRAHETARGRSHMVAVDRAGSRLYSPDMLDGVVTVFDLTTGAGSDVEAGAGAEGIAVTPDGAEVWVSNNRANTITVIDARTLAPVATLPSGGDTPVKLRISPDGSQAWVANNRSGEVAVFDVARRELIGTIAAGPRPLGIAFDANGARALVSLAGAAQVLVVDTETRGVVGRVPVGASPDGLAFVSAVSEGEGARAGAAAVQSVAGVPEIVFPAADGAMIYADIHRSGRARAPLLLMLHQGGASARGEYGPILPRLLEAGYDALAVDLRRGGDRFGGSNRTVAALGHNDTPYCDVYPDVTAAFARALELADGAPVVAWGSSYSGTLALRLAADHPDRVAAVLAFSPASGGPLADCPANEQAERLAGPALVVRPVQEAAIPSVQEQLEIFAAAGHQTYVTDPGTHGSSTLVPERIEGGGDVERAWALVLEFLRQAVAGASD
ncbi:MAG: alpha/beta fold hydrolase [Gemmatimonadota bacterium]